MSAALTCNAARVLTDEVKADSRALWMKLEQLYEGEAHKVLGYASWGAYCAAEFDLTTTRAYELLDAGRVAHIFERSAIAERPVPQSEAVARELAPLRREPEAMEQAWDAAVERHGPKPTAAQVREIVRPEPPGHDIRFARIENAADSLRTLPAPDRMAWPTEAGDVEAMDDALRFLGEWLPAARAVWRLHKRSLKATAGVPAAMGNGTRP